MYNPNIIEIRCKKCGRLYMKIELEGKFNFIFSCKRCKYDNTGTVTNKYKNNGE